jgi:hypothetical protein
MHSSRGSLLRSNLLLLRPGVPPTLIVGDVAGTSFSTSTMSLGAGPVRVRIDVSDGAHLVRRTSRTLTIPPTRPQARILDITSTSVSGMGSDASFGLLDGPDLTWRLDGRVVAHGSAAPVAIPPGWHRLTLTARTPLGAQATDTRTVQANAQVPRALQLSLSESGSLTGGNKTS